MITNCRGFQVLALLLLATPLLASCGDAAEPDGAAEAPEPAGGEAEPEDMALDVGQISNSIGFFPLFVAEQEGFFEEEGLTLGERPRLQTGARLAAALTSGSIEIAAGVMTDAFTLASAERSAQVIGSLANGYYLDIVISDEVAQESGLTEQDALEDKVRALEGRNIGITGPGSGTEALVIYLLEQNDLSSERDVTLVNLGADFSAVFSALRSGQVDALSFFWPVPQEVETQGIGEILVSPAGGDIPEMEGQTHGVFFTTDEVIEAKPEAVQAFIRGIAQAEAFLAEDSGAGRELLAEYQDTLDDATLDAEYEALQQVLPATPMIEEEGFATAVDFHEAAGLVEEGSMVYADVVAADLIEEAVAELDG